MKWYYSLKVMASWVEKPDIKYKKHKNCTIQEWLHANPSRLVHRRETLNAVCPPNAAN